MNSLLYKLLGIDPGQDTLRPDRIFYVQPWPWLAALAAGAVVLAWVVLFYVRDGSRPSLAWKGVMAALRIGAVLVLGWMLWQPMLRGRRVERTPSVVAVLIDESKSMGFRDAWRDRKRVADLVRALEDPAAGKATRSDALFRLLNRSNAELLRELMERHSVRVYRFGSVVRGAELAPARAGDITTGAPAEKLPLRSAAPVAEQTRIGSAIEYAVRDTAGQPLAGIVLLSDGGQNLGEDPTAAARRAGAAGTPVHTIGFGDPTPPRDLAVSSILTDEVVRKGDDVVVSIALRQRGFRGKRVPLTLRLGSNVLHRVNVALGADGARQEVTLSFTPETPGSHTLTAAIPGQPEEVSVANNRKDWPIRIVDKKLKILYVEGRPRWEYRYLKNAILRDPTTRFACLLVDAERSMGGEGNVPLYAFPRDRKELFTYDILILGDVPRDFFSAADMKNIRGFVEERGGSLVAMAGELFLPWQYRGTDLEAVWPIVVPASRREILFRDPFQVELTDAGARNPMMFLAGDPQKNRQVWQSLPGMYWCGVADRVKPGATVLAHHPTQTGPDGKIPLMAVQQVGEGTSFMTMVDSTWQWRFRVGDTHFYRFWGQVLRSLTPHELPGANRFVRLTTDRSVYALGEKVVLRARLLTPSYQPVRLRQVMAQMDRTDGQRFQLRLDPVAGAPGVYAGEWLPEQAGTYTAALIGADGRRRESATNVVVEAASLEAEEPQQNEALLRRLAAVSGGRYLLWTEAGALPGLLPDRHQEVASRVEHDLWDAPLPLVVFMFLIVGEWVLRKRKGLL